MSDRCLGSHPSESVASSKYSLNQGNERLFSFMKQKVRIWLLLNSSRNIWNPKFSDRYIRYNTLRLIV